jgi:microcin C transport system permease protein
MKARVHHFFWGAWIFWIFLSLGLCMARLFFANWPTLLTPEWISENALPFEAPSFRHWWGTDELGRDVLVRLFFGTGYSLFFAFIVATLTTGIGITIGASLSFLKSFWKNLGSLVVDVISTLPLYPMILLTLAFYPGQIVAVGTIKVLLGWGTLAQLTKAESEVLKHQVLITAARSQGLSSFSILFRHYLPQLSFLGLSFFPMLVFSNLFTLATLDYFGLGFPIPTPNLAELLRQFQGNPGAWWLFVFPITVTSSLLLGLQLLGRRRH